jgi:hypothetical protein
VQNSCKNHASPEKLQLNLCRRRRRAATFGTNGFSTNHRLGCNAFFPELPWLNPNSLVLSSLMRLVVDFMLENY